MSFFLELSSKITTELGLDFYNPGSPFFGTQNILGNIFIQYTKLKSGKNIDLQHFPKLYNTKGRER